MPGLKVGDPVEVLSGRFAGDKGVVQFILREDQLLSPVIICSPGDSIQSVSYHGCKGK